MRSFNRKSAARLIPLGFFAVLSGCGMFSGDGKVSTLPAATVANGGLANGPAADYPVTIGDPYVVNGETYTPADVWNYDEVGFVSLDGGAGVSGTHHTLPLPSYVEVTSLETGKTILVRLERRGPMTSSAVVGLSSAAARQLGVAAGTPVRVRRVNPPEPERAALRAGEAAPERMETPMSLVAVLKRKLPESGAPTSLASAASAAQVAQASPPPSSAAPAASGSSSYALPPLQPAGSSYTPPVRQPAPVVATPRPQSSPSAVAQGGFIVQAGAFSTRDRAERVARVIGGDVSKSGSLYRVRTGPFPSRGAAEASLAKVRAAGYSDARIFSDG